MEIKPPGPPAPTTHFLNSDFDLTLRPRPRQLDQPRLVRQIHELSAHALLGAAPDDFALLHVDVPADFPAYLTGCGIAVPKTTRYPRIDPASRLRPFGWSAEAIELNRTCATPVDHPPLSCIRRVNSRSFALEVESELFPEQSRGMLVERLDELDSLMGDGRRWVIKAEHGHSGLANRRLGPGSLTPADRRFVERRLAEDDRLLLEPWLRRERDWSVVFDVPYDAGTLRIHQTLCTADGALLGALFEPKGGAAEYRDRLTRIAERIAARLEAEGYFGPVCVDAFSWRDGDRLRLRPLVDLNCRRSMSDGAHRMWRQNAPRQVLLYRFFNRRKLNLPSDLGRAVDALGENRYDAVARRGVIFASPLRLVSAAADWRPGKLAVIFVAGRRTGVRELEDDFRSRFEI